MKSKEKKLNILSWIIMGLWWTSTIALIYYILDSKLMVVMTKMNETAIVPLFAIYGICFIFYKIVDRKLKNERLKIRNGK